MVNVTDASTAASRYGDSASGVQSRYEEGINNPSNPWQESTLAQVGTWESGVQQAISNGSFETGVADTSNSEWQDRSLSLGASRIATGIRESTDKYEQSVAPFFSALESLDLPARGPRGDVDQNIERVRQVAQTLNDVRQQRG